MQEDWTNEERVEDEIIAWTEYKFIELYKTNVTEPNYLALFPMTKVSGFHLPQKQSGSCERKEDFMPLQLNSPLAYSASILVPHFTLSKVKKICVILRGLENTLAFYNGCL